MGIPTHQDAPRTYNRMVSGRRLHLLDPSPLDIDITDLALGISRQMRWGGQTIGECGYNVAQHSLVVEAILAEMVCKAPSLELRLAAVTHDLPEGAGLADLVTPVKAVVTGYHELEERMERAVRLAVGLPALLPPAWAVQVKKADIIAAVTEAVALAGWSERDARELVGKGYRGKLWTGDLTPWPETVARERFLVRYRQLGGRQ